MMGEEQIVVLANGVRMPRVGLGTYKMSYNELESAIPAALDAGYRLFDTASSYRNEKFIGDILAVELPKRNLTRKDIFITTKLRPSCQGYEKALAALCESAAALGGYIDLFLIHWPGAAKLSPDDERNESRRLESWMALQDAYSINETLHKLSSDNSESTKFHVNMTEAEARVRQVLNGVYVRAIGVSNFNVRHLLGLASSSLCRVRPHVNQCEIHPGYHQDELGVYCIQNSIHLQAYSSLGCGKLLEANFLERFPVIEEIASKRLTSYLEYIKNIRRRYGMRDNESNEINNTALRSCIVWVYLRWALQEGYSIIPKSCNPERINENYSLLCENNLMPCRLSDIEMNELRSIAADSSCKKLFWDGSDVR